MTARSAALLALVAVLAACAGDEPPAGPPLPEPGYLGVSLSVPQGVSDAGALISITGSSIDSLRATGPYELYWSPSGTGVKAIVAGTLRPGRVLEFHVPDAAGAYQVELLEVAATETFAQRALDGYSAEVSK